MRAHLVTAVRPSGDHGQPSKRHPAPINVPQRHQTFSLNGPFTGRRSGSHVIEQPWPSSEESDKMMRNGDGQQLVVSLVSATLPTTDRARTCSAAATARSGVATYRDVFQPSSTKG